MQGQEIYFHKNRKECDFIIRKNNQNYPNLEMVAKPRPIILGTIV
jgi:hypothetical protein